MARPSDFVSLVRQETTNLLTSIDRLHALKAEWDALDYGNSLPEEAFAGTNADVDRAAIAAVIGTTLSALDGLLAAGHATNLYKVRA